jgi:hypothetical protein
MAKKYNLKPKELQSVWRMMIRSQDFSFSPDRINNLVETLVGLGEIRKEVAAEARAIAAYGGEIMSGRGLTERTADFPEGESFEELDMRNYTSGIDREGLRARERFAEPVRRRLRFASDIEPQILRILQKSFKTNEGKRLFRLVRNKAVEEGTIPPTKVTRGSISAEVRAMARKGGEYQEPKIPGKVVRRARAQNAAEARRLGRSGPQKGYQNRYVYYDPLGDGATYDQRLEERESSGPSLPIVGEALGMVGSQSPEERLRGSQSKAIARLARLAKPVPLEGGRAAELQKDTSAEEARSKLLSKNTQRVLRFAERALLNKINAGKLSPGEEGNAKRQLEQVREMLNQAGKRSLIGESIDIVSKKATGLMGRILKAPKAVRERLRSLALRNSPEFKRELQKLVAAYKADVKLRGRERARAERSRERPQPRFRQVNEREVLRGRVAKFEPDAPPTAEEARRAAEREALSRNANELGRRVGVRNLEAQGRVRRLPGGRPVLLAGMSPRILEQPTELPPGRRTVSLSEAGVPVPRPAPMTPDPGVAGMIEFLREKAKFAEQQGADSRRFYAAIEQLERQAAARGDEAGRYRSAQEAKAAAEAAAMETRRAEIEARAMKPGARRRTLWKSANPVEVLRWLKRGPR